MPAKLDDQVFREDVRKCCGVAAQKTGPKFYESYFSSNRIKYSSLVIPDVLRLFLNN